MSLKKLCLLCIASIFLLAARPHCSLDQENGRSFEERHRDSALDSAKRANQVADSLFIIEVQDRKGPDKVLHAEPLYIDLIRDLGARKGEAEWNFGFGMTNNSVFDSYEFLVEYEWAPIDRLGLEVEIPMTIYNGVNGLGAIGGEQIPSNRIESIKLAAQYSFVVSEEIATSLAVGYINELEFADLNKIGKEPLFKGNLYNPFFIAAKRWGNNFHSMIYAGGRFEQSFGGGWKTSAEMHTSLHYMISGTRNFLGVEVNKEFSRDNFSLVLRPQMRLGIDDHVMIGIVTSVPVNSPTERLGMFLRLIYELPH